MKIVINEENPDGSILEPRDHVFKLFVTEDTMEKLKTNISNEDAKSDSIELDKIEIFTFENQGVINRIITIGGDGTVVNAIKMFYKEKCPKIISFGEDSLGYLGCFEYEQYKNVLYHSLIKIAPDFDVSSLDLKEFGINEDEFREPYVEQRERVVLKVGFDVEDEAIKSNLSNHKDKNVKFGTLYALNEIIVDRGPFNYLTNIEGEINGHFLTSIQGDGVIISSPTGSTAYNMSAGGSIVYNYVNSLLLTPIGPHSLSFRPLILPDDGVITLKASDKSRADYYNVSFDGDLKFQIKRGEKVDIEGTLGTLPFVTFTQQDPIEEWCKRLNSTLHWNSRPVQKVFTNKI